VLVGAITTMAMSPYPLGLRYERGTLKEYFHFGWPLMVNRGTGMVTIQATTIAAKYSTGLAGLGTIGLAANIGGIIDAVDAIITRTMYPAICAVAEKIDVLHEAFVKSNRLALMWGLPVGFGLALFASDIERFALGEDWDGVATVLAGTGIALAVTQIGFNWSAFMRARNDTKGVAVVAVGGLIASLALVVPGLLIWGLEGFAVAAVLREVVMLMLRGHYLRLMFAGFGLTRHIIRAAAPVVPTVGLLLLVRLLESGERTGQLALAEFAGYALTAFFTTWFFERRLISEVSGYVRRVLPRGGSAPVTP
jgi:O-antigen/teichoic acid export membrane protein